MLERTRKEEKLRKEKREREREILPAIKRRRREDQGGRGEGGRERKS